MVEPVPTSVTRLGRALRLLRHERGQSVRRMAAEIGIPYTTLSAIERYRPCDADTLVRVIVWLTKKHEGIAA